MAILITTTDSFENSSITKYYTPITSNIVVGTNIFGDISASLTDIFGGRSESYEKRLKSIYQNAISNLETQAKRLKANAIVGLKVDFDEISGKGVQMLMVSVTGTPVNAKFSLTESERVNSSIINGDLIESKIKARRLINKIKGLSLPQISISDFTKIANSDLDDYLEIIPPLIEQASFTSHAEEKRERASSIKAYLQNLDSTVFKNFAYPYIFDSETVQLNTLVDLIIKRDLIDYSNVIENLQKSGGTPAALLLLYSPKSDYSNQDYLNLKEIVKEFDTYFPVLSTEREEISKGLFSKEVVKVWDCSCGKIVTGNRCTNCDKDAFGYTSNIGHPPIVKKYLEEKVAVLDQVLKTA